MLCTTWWHHGPLARYVKLQVAHVLGMPGMFSPPPRVSDPHMHHGPCVMHVPWCMPGSLTSGILWMSRWWGKHSRHPQSMRNLKFYISGKRPMGIISASPALWEGNPTETTEFPSQRPIMQIFNVLFAARLNKLLNKESSCQWFEMPWCSCGVTIMYNAIFLVFITVFTSVKQQILKWWNWI